MREQVTSDRAPERGPGWYKQRPLHYECMHRWANDMEYLVDSGGLRTYRDRIVIHGCVFARRFEVRDREGAVAAVMVLVGNSNPKVTFHSYYSYSDDIAKAMPGEIWVHDVIPSGERKGELHWVLVPVYVWRFHYINTLNHGSWPGRGEFPFLWWWRRCMLDFAQGPEWAQVHPQSGKEKRLKANRHGAMEQWNDRCHGLDRKITAADTIYSNIVRDIGRGRCPEMDRFGEELHTFWHRVRIKVRACVWSDEQMDAAREWSRKWEQIDADRVRVHGAFGHRPSRTRTRPNQPEPLPMYPAEEFSARIAKWKCEGWTDDNKQYRVVFPMVPHEVGLECCMFGRAWDYLRLNTTVTDGQVETSRNVTMPVAVALRAMSKLVQHWDKWWSEAVHAAGKAGMPTPLGITAPERIMFGGFALERLGADWAKVGCHVFMREELMTTYEQAKMWWLENKRGLVAGGVEVPTHADTAQMTVEGAQ